ncbi:FHA domain-containing protein [Planctomicrobium sp. SH527]|uniref:FHA domain-containing protein n=1 Tax=Planctomicrobium sp. SH527 TaxID=3448123 RepID=UPI003F5C1BA0
MDDQFSSMLTYATATPSPIRLQIRDADGNVRDEEYTTSQVLIGRGPGCDLQFADKTVSSRHALLQAIGPRIAYIDLLSVGGIQATGPKFSGWISPEHVFKIGRNEVRLIADDWVYDDTLPSPQEFRPRDEFRAEYGLLPLVELELLNTAHQGTRWPINRIVTLIGRDDRCRITIADDRISRVQNALLLLPSGLWTIDLIGNTSLHLHGAPTPGGLLSPGTEMEIGPYRLTAHYQPSPHHQSHPVQQPAMLNTSSTEQAFLTRSNRIFQTDYYHDTIIVYPQGESYFFKDVHIEASRVVDVISQYGITNLVIDYSRCVQLPYMALEGLTSICRSITGRRAQCSANESTYNVIASAPLLKSIPHFQTINDAVQAIYVPVQTAP